VIRSLPLDRDPFTWRYDFRSYLSVTVTRLPGTAGGASPVFRVCRPSRLELHSEPVRYPVHVVEVARDLVRIDDVPIGEPCTEYGYVSSGHLPRSKRQFERVATEQAHPLGQVLKGSGDDRLREHRLAALLRQRGAVMNHS
jgi:hypothetical protein